MYAVVDLCILSMPVCCISKEILRLVIGAGRTVMAQLHLGLETAEFIRHARLGLGADLLASPLLHAIEALVDIHGRGVVRGIALVCWEGYVCCQILAIRKGWIGVSCALVLMPIDSVVRCIIR